MYMYYYVLCCYFILVHFSHLYVESNVSNCVRKKKEYLFIYESPKKNEDTCLFRLFLE